MGLRRASDATSPRLVAGGVALAVVAVAGLGGEALTALQDDPGRTVRLGDTGLVAVALAWAAHARGPWRAAVRAVVGSAALVLLVLLALTLVLLGGAIEGWLAPADEFEPVSEFVVAGPSLSELAADVLSVVMIAVAGPAARWAVRSERSWPTALPVAAVLGIGATWLAEGAVLAAVLAVPAAAWLMAVLRRAREARQPQAIATATA